MTRYIIEKYTVCSLCNGTGMIMHPDWQELHNLSHDFKRSAYDLMDEFFTKKGYYIPDEEIECHNCDGTGEIQSFENDAVFIAERGLVTREEVDEMISDALLNVLSSIEVISPTQFHTLEDRVRILERNLKTR